ncbi:MAG TPA: thiamine phosphate synthase [Candidatus Cybelea sp.]|nr:thiamine phosphate synthase [Candidatus Cybelea sp.]
MRRTPRPERPNLDLEARPYNQPRRPIACYVTDRRSLGPGPADPLPNLRERIRLSIDSGVDWIQIREKDLSGRELLALAHDTVSAAKRAMTTHSTPCVYVNDRLDIALAAEASGVHLGGQSLPAGDVVGWCRTGHASPEFRVGVSCHTMESAREAEQNGASYIFFGPVFDTPSKRVYGPPQGLDRLGDICRVIRIPVMAIGGIEEANAADCIRAGASGFAAIRLFQERSKVRLAEFLERLHAGSG